ncbi:MAG: chromosomal replication initiator protein DnaA [Candidatus Omnitrophica bacterium]|nr:chromosomal replication initiator protein DnaA [Candidatus Omnitrophota bacterium]
METVQNTPFDWAVIRERLKARLGSEVVNRWLDPLTVGGLTDAAVTLEAPNSFFRDWVLTHYLEALRPFAGTREVRVVTATAASFASILPAAVSPLKPADASPANAAPASSSQSDGSHGLNARLTFDRFVVGPSNRFSHAASLAVAESPARAYNPLFIYGGVGLGKTHLMQAIGHAILHRWPARRVVYISSERFTNELIASIQNKTTSRFRDKYRTVDVLLVDDIHFIAQKEATQEEFFHTFNALYDAHKQIVISSDRSPKEIAGLEERLVSRFEWGLVTDIQPPDLETRIAILRKKAEEAGILVPEPVTDFMAKQITANIRELEGALIRVIAYCNLFNKPLDAEIAREVLKDMVREVSARITLDEIQRRVAEYFQLDLQEMRGSRRQRSVLFPRQIAMFLCRRLTEASLPEIGRAFGGRDHTTIMHAVGKIEREITQDAHKKQIITHLNQLITAASGRQMG